MGRTVKPFSMVLEDYHKELKPFRAQLDDREKQVFDELFESVRPHTYAAVYMASPDPSEPILLSMMLEMKKRVDELEKQLDYLEDRLNHITGK